MLGAQPHTQQHTAAGLAASSPTAWSDGCSDGRSAGFSDGFSAGFSDGFSDGRSAGFSDGRRAGFSDGSAGLEAAKASISQLREQLLGIMQAESSEELLIAQLERLLYIAQKERQVRTACIPLTSAVTVAGPVSFSPVTM